MKNFSIWHWLIVAVLASIAVLLCTCLFLAVSEKGMGSAEAAGWVQAIGAVAAIFVAIAVAQHQTTEAIRHASEMDKLSVARRNQAVKGILDIAYGQCLKVKPEFEDDDHDFDILSFILTYSERTFANAILSLEAISPLELGSYDVVIGIAGLKECMVDIQRMVTFARHTNRGTGDSEDCTPDYQVKDFARGKIEKAGEFYVMAVQNLGGQPITSVPKFNDF
jgi:hypothetical protein